MLATFTVTSPGDTGAGTFRQAVADANNANGPDDIEFRLGLFDTITLASEVTIDDDLVINGINLDSNFPVNINGPTGDRILDVDGTGIIDVFINDLNLSGGNSTDGGMLAANAGATVTLNRTTWTGGNSDLGGAIFAAQATINVNESRFELNDATGRGGAIFSSSGDVNITDSVFANNSAGSIPLGFGRGGAYAGENGAQITATRTTFDMNGSSRGGAIWTEGRVQVWDSLFTENIANRGGGIFLEHTFGVSFGEVLNTTLSGNIANVSGGGIHNESVMTLTNNTIVLNDGGGIFNESANNQTNLFNSIVLGNPDGDILGRNLNLASSTHNVVGDDAGGLTDGIQGNIIGDMPLEDVIEVNLVDNGGATLLHRLNPESPARNTGDNNRAAFGGGNRIPDVLNDGDTPLAFDQRGSLPFRRTWEGTVDIGSYEQQPLLVDNTSDVDDDDIGPGQFTLREAIRLANESAGTTEIAFSIDQRNPVIVVTDQFVIDRDITIVGTNLSDFGGYVGLNGEGQGRLFWVDARTPDPDASLPSLTLRQMSLANGHADGSNHAPPAEEPEHIPYRLDGGAVLNLGGRVVTDGVSFFDHEADEDGGAISTQGGTTILMNSTFTDSSAVAFGGAFHATDLDGVDGDFTIVHSTIVGNTSETGGGGIATSLASGTTGHIFNSIIGTNTVAGVPQDFAGTNIDPNSSFNIVSTAAASAGLLNGVNGNIVGNNGLGVLDLNGVLDPVAADFGGPGKTFRLLPGGVAVNAADPNRSAIPGDDLIPDLTDGDDPLLSDSRGLPFTRSFDGAPDMGAYEDQVLTLIVDTTIDELDSDFEEDDLSFREATFFTNANPNTDTILFSLDPNDATIRLDRQVNLFRDVFIDGSNRDDFGAEGDNITIDGQALSRIMLVDATAGPVTVSISDTNFENGNALGVVGEVPESGGAILSRFGRVELQRSVFTDNRANDSGGALYNDRGEFVIVDTTFDSNTAGILGGGLANDTGEVEIVTSTFTRNHAAVDGGAIFNNNGPLSLVNSTVSGNSANIDAGGVYNEDNTVVIVNSTLVNNIADADDNGTGEGGGLQTVDDALTFTNLHNTLIAGNLAGTTSSDVGGKTPSAFNSLIADADSAAGLVHGVDGNVIGIDGAGTIPLATIVDPLLQDNGGLTRTHSLAVGSPALDIGDSNAAALPGDNNIPDIAGDGDVAIVQDQRGFPFTRVFGDAVDAGSYEVTSTWVVDTVSTVVDGDFSSGNLSFPEAIDLANQTPAIVTIAFNIPVPDPTIILASEEILTSSINIDGTNLNAAGGNVNLSAASGRILRLDGVGRDVSVDIRNIGFDGGDADGSNPVPFIGEGGGILSIESNLRLTNVEFTNNSADTDGGAVMAREGTLFVADSTFDGNAAANGAAIMSFGSNAVVTDSTFVNNVAGNAGGGIANRVATTMVMASTFDDNSAADGGAVANLLGGTLHVLNSTLSSNEAANHGAGGVNQSGNLVFVNSTIAANTADSDSSGTGVGGGVWTAGGSETRLYNTIVAGNDVGTGADNDLGGSNVFPTSSNNLVGNADSSGGLVDATNSNIVGNGGVGTLPLASILETTLQSNGGLETTTHRLIPGSPAIDAGDSNRAALPGANNVPDVSADGDLQLISDQRGEPFPRVTGPVDIGAYEVTHDWVVNVGGDVDDSVYGVGEFSLREAVRVLNSNPGPDTITFDIGLSRSSIELAGSELQVMDDLTINGLGAASLTIDAAGLSRLFNVMPGQQLDINHLTLTGGSTGAAGGAILNQGTLTVSDSALVGNIANNGGAIMAEGPTEIRRTEISGNTADFGAGVDTDASGAVVNIENSTISGNTATSGATAGAGIHVFDAVVVLANSTVASNVASGNGDGAGVAVDVSGTAAIANSIVADNVSTGAGADIFGSVSQLQFSIVEDSSGFTFDSGSDNLFVDPMLQPLANNHGQTQTHALSDGSPAIDEGNGVLTPAGSDQTGQPRTIRSVDMGAAEYLLSAFDDAAGTTQDTPISVNVLGNDNPSSGTEIRSVAGGTNGTAVISGGQVEYTPDAGFTGTDSFTYTMGIAQQQHASPTADAELGNSIAIDGDWMVVGAQSEDGQNPDGGGARVYKRNGGRWDFFQTIDADDEETLDRFGYDVAIQGTTIVIGARMDDDRGVNSGSVYVYEYNAAEEIWVHTEKLVDQFNGSTRDQFGHAVAIDGDTIVVGARLDDGGGRSSGAIHIFERTADGWASNGRILASDTDQGDQFGSDVAIEGNTIVVGARKDDTGGTDSGSAYIFEKQGGVWVETAEILASNTRRNNFFGFSVDISGDTVVVGMPIRSDRFREGEVHVFERNLGGTDNWGEVVRLTESDNPEPQLDQFGYSVAIDGDYVAGGARRADSVLNNAGLVYLFSRNLGGADAWGLQERVVSEGIKAGDNLGHAVALDNGTLAMGAPLQDEGGRLRSGSIYIEDLRTRTATANITVNALLQAREAGTNVTTDLTEAELGQVIGAAVSYWQNSSLTYSQSVALEAAAFSIADLDGLQLGLESGGSVQIDVNAAGHGWYIDQTPFDTSDDNIGDRVDLLTVVTHELGHVIGHVDIYDDAQSDDIMYGFLNAGERRSASEPAALDALFGSLGTEDELFVF